MRIGVLIPRCTFMLCALLASFSHAGERSASAGFGLSYSTTEKGEKPDYSDSAAFNIFAAIQLQEDIKNSNFNLDYRLSHSRSLLDDSDPTNRLSGTGRHVWNLWQSRLFWNTTLSRSDALRSSEFEYKEENYTQSTSLITGPSLTARLGSLSTLTLSSTVAAQLFDDEKTFNNFRLNNSAQVTRTLSTLTNVFAYASYGIVDFDVIERDYRTVQYGLGVNRRLKRGTSSLSIGRVQSIQDNSVTLSQTNGLSVQASLQFEGKNGSSAIVYSQNLTDTTVGLSNQLDTGDVPPIALENTQTSNLVRVQRLSGNGNRALAGRRRVSYGIYGEYQDLVDSIFDEYRAGANVSLSQQNTPRLSMAWSASANWNKFLNRPEQGEDTTYRFSWNNSYRIVPNFSLSLVFSHTRVRNNVTVERESIGNSVSLSITQLFPGVFESD